MDNVELHDIYGKNSNAIGRFSSWIESNENLSEYDKENVGFEVGRGYIVDFASTKWFILKGLLYDFFDENEIFMEIGIDKTMEAKFCYEISWYDDVNWMVGTGLSDLEYTRVKAEQAAFIKAFDILEDILLQETKQQEE